MTLVIAHRTCPRHAPENSIEGIARAAELGADAVEMDVRLTRGSVPVLAHDAVAWQRGFVPVPVRWTGRSSTAGGARWGARLALVDALAAVRRWPGLRPVLDVKVPSAASSVVALLESVGGLPVSLWSQHESAVALFTAAGGVTDDVALLRDTFSVAGREQLLRDAERLGAGAVSAHWDAVDLPFVRQAGDAGVKVYSWCQWRDRHSEKLGIGLAGVVTDWPNVARDAGF